MLLIQYAVKLIPDINYICLSPSSLSFRIKLTITQGIKATPIATINTKSNALPV